MFKMNKGMTNKNADRHGGEDMSDGFTADILTSAVTQTRGNFESVQFNRTTQNLNNM